MSADSKIANIEAQIAAVEEGRTNVITCPYCGAQNIEPPMCCRLFAAAALAIIERQEMKETIRAVDHASVN